MSPEGAERRTHHARTAAAVALIASAVLIGVLAPQAAAARTAAGAGAPQSAPAAPAVPSTRSALPLPLPVTAVEPLVTEGVGIEGPLINNITLPTLR
ncbi:hypothetical protein C6Y14_05410 [Streptomyces dioscori]|uniref:Uncharacterized protein n=1 Tax=Streptomyces dioscori TaxID=2109333 RepID=A0A2P8QE92_9ACTN|nr:hypothetical protein C6Y14_05410 [Streptomyces dioscori]